jgi:carbamoyl-phosphate synthase large subunit
LNKLKKIIDCEVEMKNAGGSMQPGLIKRAKLLGFSDRQIGKCYKIEHGLVRSFRKENAIVPYAKQIDTLAAEWPAQTNYLYMSYLGSEHDVKFDQKDGVVVLGGGCYRIGSSVEFDYSAVMSVRSMRAAGKPVSIINCNPETVSTDFDESDRLYFEELSEERVLDIVDNEKPMGTVVSVGGQIGNNLCMPLHEAGVHILGTHPEMIDTAEDRNKFSKMLDEIGVAQPEWQALTSPEAASAFAEKVGYPVLVRASYVLSGGAFRVVRDSSDLKRFLADAVDISNDKPVVITKYLEGAQEVEIDAIANKGNIVAYAIAEHIENAGVHSGDAHMVLPAQNMSFDTFNKVLDISKRMAKALKISGPMNSQFLVKDGEVKVIEVNVRASRSLPFSSKTLGVNMIDLAARIWLGEDVKPVNVDLAQIKHVGVKVPQFSFTRLRGADPTLGVEMASTGEVACYGHNQQEALLKGMMAAQFKMPKKKILFSLPHQKEREALLSSIRTLKLMGYEILATSGTAEFLQSHNVPHTRLLWDNEQGEGQKVNEVISNRAVDLVINLPSPAFADQPFETSHGYKLRRTAVDHGVMLLTNEKVAAGFVDSMARARVLTVEPYRNPMKSQVAAATL